MKVVSNLGIFRKERKSSPVCMFYVVDQFHSLYENIWEGGTYSLDYNQDSARKIHLTLTSVIGECSKL